MRCPIEMGTFLIKVSGCSLDKPCLYEEMCFWVNEARV